MVGLLPIEAVIDFCRLLKKLYGPECNSILEALWTFLLEMYAQYGGLT